LVRVIAPDRTDPVAIPHPEEDEDNGATINLGGCLAPRDTDRATPSP
jgi:hypothetical protein